MKSGSLFRIDARRLANVTLLAAMTLVFSSNASGLMISQTGDTSGGNPGGQPLYEVTGLVQGDSFDVSWGGVTGLSVTGTVTIDSLSASDAEIRIAFDNLSTPISGDDPRVTSVGLAIPNFSSLSSTSTVGTFLTTADDSNFPGFTTDACATSGNNCAGGGNGGVPALSNEDLVLDVSGNFGSGLTLQNFALKVQGGPGGDSFELAGVPVPEPSSLLMLVPGLLLLLRSQRVSH